MIDNYAPWWELVDGFKRAASQAQGSKHWYMFHELASTLERSVREATGDLPVKEEKPDLVSAYSEVVEALKGGAIVARDMVDLQGHTVRKIDAARAQVIANRCDRALKTLKRAGELL